MIKKILVPTNFSEETNSALATAVQLAKKNNGTIYLLNIIDLPNSYTDQVSGQSSSNLPEAYVYMQSIHKRFENLIESDLLKGIDVRPIISTKKICEATKEKSEEHEIDIVVMGSQGTEKSTNIFASSKCETIIRTSKKPVLVIKEDMDINETKKIVFHSLFASKEINAANKLNTFAKDIDATIDLLYINTPKNFSTNQIIENKMLSFVKKSELENFTLNIYNDTSIENGILNFSNDINANLICMSAQEKKRMSNLINSSLSNNLVHHTNKSILTFKANELTTTNQQKAS